MKVATRRIIGKWLIVALCGVVVTVCGMTTESMSITKRGIVIGLSVDVTEKGYTVCAQMVQADASNTPEAPSAYEVVVGEGATLRQAMYAIAEKTSLYPSYAHCKVLFVGESLLSPSPDAVLLTFMQHNDLGNVQVVAVEGSGRAAITAKVAIANTSSAYIEKDNMLVSKMGGRRLVGLKEYCQRIDGKSGCKFLPYARAVSAEQPTGGEQQAATDEAVVLYDILNTVAFGEDGEPHIYGGDITRAVGLVEAAGGQFTAYTEDGRYVTVSIDSASRRRRYSENTVEGTYRYEVTVLEQTLSASGEPKAAEVEALVAMRMDETMRDAFERCRGESVDIFSVAGHLYKRYGYTVPLAQCVWRRKITVKCK